MHTRPLLRLALLVAGFGGAFAAAGCIIDWVDDCGRNYGAPGCKGPPIGAGGGGATASGTGSTTTQNGGGGTGAGCTDAGSCPPVPPGPCAALGTATCSGHQCGFAYTAGDAPSQVYGDCQKNLCDTMGILTTVADPTDAFYDGNPCTKDMCTGTLAQNLGDKDASCTVPVTLAGGFCEQNPDTDNAGNYLCAQCEPGMPSTCAGIPGDVCLSGKCVPPTCYDHAMNGNESGIDCGGPDCLPCPAGKGCLLSSDCFSQVCSTGKCVAPTCLDHVKNEDETDIDCGGSHCGACPPGGMCLAPTDCTSTVCMPTTTPPTPGLPDRCQKPTCFDGLQNGSETGVDCGGPLDGGGEGDGGAPCPPCAM